MPNPRNYSTSSSGQRYTRTADHPPIESTTMQSPATREFRSQSDLRRAKPSGKWLKPTTYSMKEWSESHAQGSYTIYHNNGQFFFLASGCLIGYVLNPPSLMVEPASAVISETFTPSVANRALLKLRTKAKDQSINLAQAFAERAQTAGLVVDTAVKLATAANWLRKKQFRKAAAALGVGGRNPVSRTTGGQWLELQYGWKPLLSDVHGAVTALEKRDRSDWRVTVKSKETLNETVNSLQGSSGGANACINSHVSKKGSYCRLDMIPGSQALISASQLGLTNPAVVAWELVPFSFVADWFVPIGEYLGQFDALAGWEVLGFSQSNFTKVDWHWQGRSTSTGSGSTRADYVPYWSSRRRFVSLDRTAGTSVPFAVYPRIKNPFSELHGWNAIALLGQALSSLRR
jgi:hypothetical protein